jgi:hypothetical protein
VSRPVKILPVHTHQKNKIPCKPGHSFIIIFVVITSFSHSQERNPREPLETLESLENPFILTLSPLHPFHTLQEIIIVDKIPCKPLHFYNIIITFISYSQERNVLKPLEKSIQFYTIIIITFFPN